MSVRREAQQSLVKGNPAMETSLTSSRNGRRLDALGHSAGQWTVTPVEPQCLHDSGNPLVAGGEGKGGGPGGNMRKMALCPFTQ